MENIREKFSDFNEAQVYAETIVSMYRKPTLLLDGDLIVLAANPVFYQKFGGSRESLAGLRIDGGGGRDGGSRLNFSRLQAQLAVFPPGKQGNVRMEMTHPVHAEERWLIKINTREVELYPGTPPLTVLTIAEMAKKPGAVQKRRRLKKPAAPDCYKPMEKGRPAGDASENIEKILLRSIPEGLMVFEAPNGRLLLSSIYHDLFTGMPGEDAKAPGPQEPPGFLKYFCFPENGRRQQATTASFPAFRSLKTGAAVAAEPWQLKRSDGTWADVLINSRPVRNAEGEISHAVMSWRDTTHHKAMEAELRRKEFHFRTLVENSPDIILRFDRKMHYLFVNAAFEQISGMSRERVCGKTNRELGMSEAHLKSWESAAETAVARGRKVDFEFSFPGVFGERHFLGRVIPEYDDTGTVETLMLIGRDITERKEAEERIRHISFHDNVTGLYNRAYFEEELKRLDTRRSLPLSIIVGDVNHLKLTNDTFGHSEGDRLLQTIARIMRKCCRDEDIIARWGGDEFAVILPGTPELTAKSICSRIQKSAEGHPTALLIRPSIALGTGVKMHADENIFSVISEAEERMYEDKLIQSGKNRDVVIRSLLDQVRQKCPEHKSHMERLRESGRVFGHALGLKKRELDDLHMIILLHDIGKAIVPDSYLQKQGRLNEDEWEVMKRYPEAGFRIVKTFAETARISEEILSLREHWDGSGYPRGLRGREIPLLARVFAIIDSYDIMTHERPYGPALRAEKALRELARNAGKQFDPRLVEKFVQTMRSSRSN